jgi:predicted transposase/invertase (TIGR01784 family)
VATGESNHDKAFKALMKEPGALEALLRERLPPALVRRFVGPPVQVSETFVDQALRSSFADVVARVRLDGDEETVVYCLIEHKRTAGRQVFVQLLRYLANLYEHLERQAKGRKVPPVVAMLIYNGATRWAGPTRFRELLDVDNALAPLVLDFGVVVLDLGATDHADVAKHPTLRAGLLALKVALLEGLEARRALLREVFLTPPGEWTRELFVQYLLNVGGRELEPVVRAAEAEAAQEPHMQTIAEYYVSKGVRRGMSKGLKKGIEKGIEKGRVEGRVEGRLEGLRLALTSVLTRRFKKVPARVTAKLAEADEAALQRWHERAIDAASLDAVFK